MSEDIRRLMKQWGVPARIAEIALRAQYTDAIQHASEFLSVVVPRDDKNILVLAGGVGVGKSVAAAWTAMSLPPNGYGAFGVRRFKHTAELCELLSSYDADQKKERDLLKSCRVLVLDDVGTEHMTEAFQTFFDGLVNARYEHDGITVITTNLTSDLFRERYGLRIYDRLRGRGAWYDIAHASLRGGDAA